MQRVTITIEDELLADIDALVEQRGYANRSEALRDLARAGMRAVDPPTPDEPCVGALVYVYDHGRRDLSAKLASEFHGHHDLGVATLHVHLDQQSCLEVAVLRGTAGAVRHMADHVTTERGVRYGQLIVLPRSGA
jgi:CopG family transcriptional regulator, nickel-responsive regulator